MANENGKRMNTNEKDERQVKLMKNDANISLQTSIMQNMRKNSTISVILKSKNEKSEEKLKIALDESDDIMMAATPEIPEIQSQLDFYGLPKKVKELLETNQGITKLYAWQDECLRSPAICNRRNMILCLPTSGGKTVIAEILILKELLRHNCDALLVLPFVSIVQEKVREMSPLAVNLDFNVEEYAGSKGGFPPKKKRNRRTVYIATIEKAHSLVNSLIELERLKEIGLLVVDEFHMVGDGEHRGATLENTITKVKFMQHGIQIIGMSATLGNTNDVQKFLNAEIYAGNFRPVELKEYIKLEDNLMEIDPKPVAKEEKFIFIKKCQFQMSNNSKTTDPDQISGLVLEVVPENSCLVFCPTKKTPKMSQRSFQKECPKSLSSEENGSICKILQFTIPYGVAYHHSGLTMDERRHLEEAYSSGVLCCLACTSTLAAGVNLPAKRVILRSPYIANEFLTLSKYKQMVGRAGRTGIDTSGESILIIQPRDRNKVYLNLFNSKDENRLTSSLHNNTKGVKSLILSLVGLKITKTINDIDRFLSMTLLEVQKESFNVDMIGLRTEAIKDLIKINLIKASYDNNDRRIENALLSVTELGRAAFKGSIVVDIVDRLYKDLTTGLNGLVLHNHLHLLFLVTPYEAVRNVRLRPDIFQEKYMKLGCEDTDVATNIGIPVSHVTAVACGKSFSDMTVIERFYATLILYDLWRGKSVWDVANDFELHRGTIQQLLTSAIGFASCVFHFCQELTQFWAYNALLEKFVKQFSYCVSVELVPLMELPSVKRGRANLLYKNGYRTVQDVANGKVNELVRVVPFMPRKVATEIIAAAQMLIIEKAKDLQDEADDLVEGLNS
uniref:Helicase POLQ-like n=1 Tax=Strigamia maritima TaxID=126957 RepID=T1IU61_STRMM